MVLNQTIISKHFIKPSVVPPNGFKPHQLSYLDQMVEHIYMCPVFFYKDDESKSNIEISGLLKQSLSQVLTVFHPFAGIINGNSFIDCNVTGGVELVEAQIHTHLAQVIDEQEMEGLKQLAPLPLDNSNAILSVKVNFFDCGGIAIGISLSRKVADFTSILVFMNTWASMCRGETQIIPPVFNMALHFPPRDFTPFNLISKIPNYKTKSFVFDKEKLERLQQQSSSTEVKDPSKVEALTLFFSQLFIQATKAILGQNKTSFIIQHVINLRPLLIPPIPDQTIGNCVSTFHATISDTADSGDLISKLRAAKNSVDNSFIKEVINTGEYLKTMHKRIELSKSGTELLAFSSIWRFPTYDINFGWGKPIWYTTNTDLKNTIIFMSTSTNDGIEACVNMSEDYLQILEINYNKFFNL